MFLIYITCTHNKPPFFIQAKYQMYIIKVNKQKHKYAFANNHYIILNLVKDLR